MCIIADDGSYAALPLTICAALPTFIGYSRATIDTNAYGNDVSKYVNVQSRAQVVREVLANKRALIILDNAWHSDDVIPLLPPTGTCAVIVTTRRHDLSITRGARRFNVGPFDKEKREAFDLFVKILGEERVQGESSQLEELADLLGHLPLALDIAVSRLAYEPGWSVLDFVERVRQEKRRLDELNYEDVSVRLSFDLSYDLLSPSQRQFFAALGVFGGEDFGIEAVANITQVPLKEVQDNLRRLYALSLIEEGRVGRYRLHPLLRDYAKEHVTGIEPFTRMVAYFVSFIDMHCRDYNLLDIERGNLFSSLQLADELGMLTELMKGATSLWPFLDSRGLYKFAEDIFTRMYQLITASNTRNDLASVFLHLAQAAQRQMNYEKAKDFYQNGLAIAREDRNDVNISLFLQGLAMIAERDGQYDTSKRFYNESLEVARNIEQTENTITSLRGLGVVTYKSGDIDGAEAYYQQALLLAQKHELFEHSSNLLYNIGAILYDKANYDGALDFFQQSLELASKIGHRELISRATEAVGAVSYSLGDFIKAKSHFQEALKIAYETGYHEHTGNLLTSLGAAEYRCGNYSQARLNIEESLSLAQKSGHHENTIYCLSFLAEVIHKIGDDRTAEKYFREALELLRNTGNRSLLSNTLNAWAEFHYDKDDIELAGKIFAESLQNAQAQRFKEEMAVALYGLARVAFAQGRLVEARNKATESLTIYDEIRHFKVEEVRNWIVKQGLLN